MSTQPIRRAADLRRSVLAAKSRRKSGKGGWRGTWKDRLDIPKAEETDILLTRGEYPNPEDVDEKTGEAKLAHFHTCKQHGFKLKPKGEGSYFSARCNIDADQEDCIGCMRKEQGDRRVTTKDTFSFNVLHIALHRKVPLERDGKVVKYEEGDNRGKPIMTWELVEKPKDRKAILADLDGLLEDGEVALFRKKYIEVGAGHRDELSMIQDMAAKFCKCGGKLKPIRFSCEECEEELADVEDDDMSAKEIAAFSESRERCKKCGHVGIPVPESICDTCRNPEPLTAFDVVATVKKEGEGASSHIVIKAITPLDRYQLPNEEYLIEWEKSGKDFVPKEDENGDWVFSEDLDLRKSVESQWDFEKVHEPRDHGYIAKRLDCENPFKESATGSSKYRNYGASGSRSRVDEGEDKPSRGRGRREEPEEDVEEEDERPRRRGDDDDDAPRRRQRVGSR